MKNVSSEFFHRYTISLTHGPFSWVIKKRYKQIQNLHQQLLIFRTSLNFPLPTKTHKNKRNYVKDAKKKMGGKKKKRSLPRFPKKPEVLITYDKLESRQRQLEDYLNNLFSTRIYRNHPATVSWIWSYVGKLILFLESDWNRYSCRNSDWKYYLTIVNI